jgi:hypothetical protein
VPTGHWTCRARRRSKYPTRVVTSCPLPAGMGFFFVPMVTQRHPARSLPAHPVPGQVGRVVHDCFLLRKRYDRRDAVIIALEGAMKEVQWLSTTAARPCSTGTSTTTPGSTAGCRTAMGCAAKRAFNVEGRDLVSHHAETRSRSGCVTPTDPAVQADSFLCVCSCSR